MPTVMAQDQLWEKFKSIIIDCSKNGTCTDLCIVEKMGIIDQEGRYVESKSLEWMKLSIDRGPLSQPQANRIAKTCNRVNKKIAKDCAKGSEVTTCIKTEMEKLVPDIDKYRQNKSNSMWL